MLRGRVSQLLLGVRTTGCATLAVAAVLALPAAAAGAAAGAGGALATGGLVVNGGFTNGDATVGGPFGFVIPSDTCVGGSLVPGVDFCKPWAHFAWSDATKSRPATALGSLAADCSSLANTARFSDGYPVMNPQWDNHPRGLKPRSGIYFEISCDEPGGYDFLRVEIDDKEDERGPWGLFNGEVWGVAGTSVLDGKNMTWTWGDYKGYTTFAHDNGAAEVADARLYGHDASGFHLIDSDSAKMFPYAAEVVTTAAGAGSP